MLIGKEEALTVKHRSRGSNWSLRETGDDLISLALFVVMIFNLTLFVFYNIVCLFFRLSLFELDPIFRLILFDFHRFLFLDIPLIPIQQSIISHSIESAGNGHDRTQVKVFNLKQFLFGSNVPDTNFLL